jgi:Uma2 family endonuclease
VEALSDELEVPRIPAGSTTYKSELLDRGLAADESYDIASIQPLPTIDPDPKAQPRPPDFAIEVELTRSALNRLEIYAALGVTEVWRFDGDDLAVHILDSDKHYHVHESSVAFPSVPMSDVMRLITDPDLADEQRWAKRVRNWIRDELVPRTRA